MKLVMTLLVRNAADTLEENLRYHRAQGVDYFIVTDNLSSDATPAMLRKYEALGWLRIIEERDDTYEQGVWVTRMARMAALELRADWVIHNDADEFWWPIQGTLKETFDKLDGRYNVVEARRSNFVFRCRPWYRRSWRFVDLIYREIDSKNSLGNLLPPKVAHRGHPDVIMPTGNHRVENIGIQNKATGCVEIFHYPVRSREQLRDKIRTGCRAVVQHADKHPGGTLSTWKKLYEEAEKKGGFDALVEESTYNGKRLRRETRQGRIQLDTRLRDFMRRLDRSAVAQAEL